MLFPYLPLISTKREDRYSHIKADTSVSCVSQLTSGQAVVRKTSQQHKQFIRNEHEKRSEHEIEDEPEASKHLGIIKKINSE